MKYESVINHPGGSSRCDEDTRIVGFRVKISEIEKSYESYNVINPNILKDLAIEYLQNWGYEVTKK